MLLGSPVRFRRSAILGGSLAVLLALLGAVWIATAAPASGATETAAEPTSCIPSLTEPFRSPAYADTPWPTEHADPWRTHAAPTGLPADLEQARLVTRSAKLPREPVWGYDGTGGKIYVFGGSPYLLDMFTQEMLGASRARIPFLTARTLAASEHVTPYLAQIDARTLAVKVLPLPGGSLINYTGGALVHSNGFVYAVARGVLYKIDPERFRIVRQVELPAAPDENEEPNPKTTYNGIAAAADGDLILKGWASSGGGEDAPGQLLRVDPKDLSFKGGPVSGISSARMAIVAGNGGETLYLPSSSAAVRFAIAGSRFLPDSTWTAEYLGRGDTQASSDVYMGSGVLFANNTSPQARTPARVFAKGAGPRSELRSYQAFEGRRPGWNFFMMVGDPYRTGIAAVGDQATGRVSGFLACGGGNAALKLWENDEIHSSAGMAVNYEAGQLYTDDRECPSKRRCRLYLVVLDLRSGTELARVRVRGTKPSMSQIFIGRGAVYYLATQTGSRSGFITRVSAADSVP